VSFDEQILFLFVCVLFVRSIKFLMLSNLAIYLTRVLLVPNAGNSVSGMFSSIFISKCFIGSGLKIRSLSLSLALVYYWNLNSGPQTC
jgi:hypothetical protein